MFCKSVVESDQFTEMPAEAQALYLHLNMAADDDGFCDSPRKVMRSCGASNDSMKILLAKKFVLSFEKGDNFVVVVKHWRMNNYIRKDTYHETRYKEMMRELYLDENQSYSTNSGDGHVPAVPGTLSELPRLEAVSEPSRTRDESVSGPSTQDRLGKLSLVKESLKIGEESKGESEGEPTAHVSEPVRKPHPGDSDLLNQTKEDRIRFWRGRVAFMKEQGYNPECMYDLAKSDDGLTRAEIDGFVEK
jgi:hypothetical protein